MTHPQFIGSAEACSLLGGINRSTLTRWVKAGRLHTVTQLDGPNGALVFRREDVLALLETAPEIEPERDAS
ncbi:MAG TPA: helix-turn-helix domain-containing protein [Cellulomonadaceae bacterium]|nr:helix-turn-helix domain-containing protein [Cellulomonadaceae bacterium]